MAQTVYDPPVSTYVPLQTITLSGSASSVTFSSIPNTYRDLIIVSYLPSVAALGGYFGVRFNGDSGNNYSEAFMFGAGSGSGTSILRSGIDGHFPLWDYTKNNALITVQVMDYSASDKHKTSLARGQSPEYGQVTAASLRWANNDPITSVTLTIQTRTFESGCTFSIYGIAA